MHRKYDNFKRDLCFVKYQCILYLFASWKKRNSIFRATHSFQNVIDSKDSTRVTLKYVATLVHLLYKNSFWNTLTMMIIEKKIIITSLKRSLGIYDGVKKG